MEVCRGTLRESPAATMICIPVALAGVWVPVAGDRRCLGFPEDPGAAADLAVRAAVSAVVVTGRRCQAGCRVDCRRRHLEVGAEVVGEEEG